MRSSAEISSRKRQGSACRALLNIRDHSIGIKEFDGRAKVSTLEDVRAVPGNTTRRFCATNDVFGDAVSSAFTAR